MASIDDDDNDLVVEGVSVDSMASPGSDSQASSSWRRYCLKLRSLTFSFSIILMFEETHRGVVDSITDRKD